MRSHRCTGRPGLSDLAGAARLFGHTVGWPGSLVFAGGANYLVIVSQLASSSLTIVLLYRFFLLLNLL